MGYNEDRLERLEFYNKCCESGSIAPVDPLMLPVLEHVWQSGDKRGFFPVESCQGHDPSEYMAKELAAMNHGRSARTSPPSRPECLMVKLGHLRLYMKPDERVRDFLLTGLPSYISVSSSRWAAEPRHPFLGSGSVTYQWHFQYRDNVTEYFIRKFSV